MPGMRPHPPFVYTPAILIDHLTKIFRIPTGRQVPLPAIITGMFGNNWRKEDFVALSDVSLSVDRGEWLGIIGNNGSGKSTLLKCIANTIRPTSGTVEVNGTIASFLELGVGFQWDISLEENIKLYGAIMNIPEKEITDKIDAILDFSGTTRFRQAKLRALSTGMVLRLAFATAIQTKPDILLIDEAFSVGDMDFQKKCYSVLRGYRDSHGITALLVSHDMSIIRGFCDTVIALKAGKIAGCGNTEEMIQRYKQGEFT